MTTITTSVAGIALAAALTGLLVHGAAQAQAQAQAPSPQAFPTRPIQMVVPFAAGGAIDQMARAMGASLSRELGQQVVVENKPGAGGNIGAEQIAKAAPTGYSVLVGTSATHGVNPALFPRLPFDAVRDFTPIAHWGSVPNVLVVRASSDIRSVPDLIAQAQREPGKLTFGSAGNGTSLHLAGELFKQAASVDMTHVPYKGGAPAAVDLLGGNIAMMFDTVTVSLPNLKAGKTRALAVAAAQRHPALPDVPTFAELGYPSVVCATWAGMFVPAATPPAVVAALTAANRRALADPAVVEVMNNTGVQIHFMDSAAFGDYVGSEIALWGGIVKKGNIRAD
ncbi:MFS transporter [Pigmentiphaga litoralis]|uniref:Bug family tripartite tricarboxylate transporter substrate binding protein n=1 Tax=Pigmentiphaga litoralis TaxID=516702 RepID=UPI001679F1CF|nr:tripartite tricarboxylate transporter substrate binding protein [Pigmentiphaga litoralis]GGX34457.1 MFS transporter [Pigmentiphaga litoralis]